MDYPEFFARFGGSYRTTHVRRPLLQKPGAWLRVAPRALARPPSPRLAAARAIGRITYSPRLMLRNKNKRPWYIPPHSQLPREFIRLDPWEGEYLFAVAAHARQGIVETGRFRGGSTFLLACANPRVPITSIDIAPQDDARLEALFDRHDVGGNVRLVVGDSGASDPATPTPDVVFVDGDHSYDGCTADLETWYPRLLSGGHLLVHDSYLGTEVQEAVLDFAAEHDAAPIRPPFIHGFHWQTDAGSLAHFVKPG